MQRVLVCGCPGSGKSTLALKLAAKTGLPHVSLDAHFYQPDWVPGETMAFRARMAPLIAQERWIFDGSFFEELNCAHLARATHVIWLDMPRPVCVSGILLRLVRDYGRVRPEAAPGCPERFIGSFLLYVWNYAARERPGLVRVLAGLRADQSLVRLTTRAAVDAYILSLPIEKAA